MRLMRFVGSVAVSGALAIAALAAGSASAALPELGRCTKVQGVQEGKKVVYHGAYRNKGCTAPSRTGTGQYEFLPGPGANNKFYGIATEPEPVLETTAGAKVSCGEMVFKGEYTGPKTEQVSVSFGGCETTAANGAHQVCQTNPAKEGEIEGVQALEGELGLIQAGSMPSVGWDLKHSGPMFTYECGVLPEVPSAQTVEGSVIGLLSHGFFGTDLNKMSLHSVIKYKAKGGLQMPEAFEGQAKDVLSTTTVSGTTKTTAQTGLTTTEETESGLGESHESPANQEPLEVKTK